MKNRYSVLKSSVHVDEYGISYPDIFSLNIDSFKITKNPQKYILSERDIYRFDLLMYAFYNDCNYDDLTLMLNKFEHISDVKPGSEILIYAKEDLDNFYRENYI